MKARRTPINRIEKLSEWQKSVIVKTALNNDYHYMQRVDKLKRMDFCTDDVKFEVLHKSGLVKGDLYKCLYDLYFGTADNIAQPFDSKPIEFYEHELKVTKDMLPEASAAEEDRGSADQKNAGNEMNHSPRFSEAENKEFLESYFNGTPIAEIARKYGLTKRQAQMKVVNMKNTKKYREVFEMNDKKSSDHSADTSVKPSGTIADKLTELDISIPKQNGLPKAFTAKGKGFVTTDNGGLQLDEEPIVKMLRQAIIEKGLMQFYAEVEIMIRPSAPTGMIVAVEE